LYNGIILEVLRLEGNIPVVMVWFIISVRDVNSVYFANFIMFIDMSYMPELELHLNMLITCRTVSSLTGVKLKVESTGFTRKSLKHLSTPLMLFDNDKPMLAK
jgi:hypothetical protein